MRTLVVSADDFGLTKSVNEGIAKACREGIVTNLNLMPTGEAFDDAVRLAKELGLTEAGAHLALTESAPLSVHNKIPTLVGKKGSFRPSYVAFVRDLFLGRVDLDQAYIELRTQLATAARSGLRITSLSSHEHIHLMPAILDIFVKLALEYDIPFIRYPRREKPVGPLAPGAIYKNAILSFLGKPVAHTLKEAGLRCTDHFIGLLDSGAMNETKLVAHIASLDEGTTELVMHPGFLGPEVVDRHRFHLRCEEELFALTGKKALDALREKNITLAKFSELPS